MADRIFNKLMYDFSIYSKVFPEGDIPLDTREWLNTYEPYTPQLKLSKDKLIMYSNMVLERALNQFLKYDFKLVILDGETHGPNKYWLHYKLNIRI